jgi:2-polyprenyl-3-methyl-5-hydroxy-6-metoxy-1,4-benzoquinol methylase
MSEGSPADYRYRAAGNPSGAAGERLSRLIVAEIQARHPGKAVCELGCGNGYLSGLLGELGFEVLGVDASDSGIEIAQEHYGGSAAFLSRAIGPGLAADLGRERFDVVVSSEVIEHLYTPGDLLDVAFAVFRPGGLLVLTTPYHGYLKNLVIAALGKFDVHVNPLWDGVHIKFFSPRTLSVLVAGSGFGGIEFAYFGRAPWLWKSMVCVARKP